MSAAGIQTLINIFVLIFGVGFAAVFLAEVWRKWVRPRMKKEVDRNDGKQ